MSIPDPGRASSLVATLIDPNFRAVDALTGTVAERQAIKERDDARAELDNMVNLTLEVGRLGNYLKHSIADRDEFRDMYLEYRDKYEAAQCRMDEMSSEIRELQTELATARTERDTANARVSR